MLHTPQYINSIVGTCYVEGACGLLILDTCKLHILYGGAGRLRPLGYRGYEKIKDVGRSRAQ